MKRLPPKTRKSINKELHELTTNKYFEAIPLSTICEIVKQTGFQLVNEDLTPLSCLLCGEEGHADFDIATLDLFPERVENSVVSITWYKMTSGRYEVVAYTF